MADTGRVRVLLIAHELSLTGAPRLALRIFRELGDRIDLRIVAGEGGPLRVHFSELGSTWIVSSPSATWSREPRAWLRARAVKTRVAMWHPDVIYANSVLALPIVVALRAEGARVIVHVHESSVSLTGFETFHPGLIASIPDVYIAVSQVVADALISGYGVSAKRIRVFPPFVDTSELAGQRSVRRGSQPLIVGGMGNPSWTKGVELWLLMAKEIVARRPDLPLRFRWVGVRDNLAGHQFRAMTRKLRLEDVVELVPETAEPLEHLARFDILAVSSWEESASMIVLEAMALKVPVVCFAGSGGPAEELGLVGTVISSFSPSEMAEAAIKLLEDPGRRRNLAAAGLARVTATYGMEQTVPAIGDEIMRLGRARSLAS